MKLLLAAYLSLSAGICGQSLKPETAQQFDCYVQTAESRMDGRKTFLLADANTTLNNNIHALKVETLEANGANPHKLSGGQVYDWIGAVFIPGATLERLVRMLQAYDQRAVYFPETISSSKLLAFTPPDRFQYSMRMKEPAVMDVESDVVWERLDASHIRCRSLSTRIDAVGKDHGYLRRLNSYWRFAETPEGVSVEAETITLSDEFGAVTRALGSALMGINPEKSLRHSLISMRESAGRANIEIAKQREGLPPCGAPVVRSTCVVADGKKE